MNYRKLVGAVVAALVGLCLLGTALPASAGGDNNARITITGDSVAGRKFTAYQIATYEHVLIGETLVRVDLQTRDAIRADLGEWLAEESEYDEDGPTDPLMWIAENWANDETNSWHDVFPSGENVRTVANWLTAWIAANDDHALVTESASGGSFEVPEGLYLVVEGTPGSFATWRSLPIIIGTKYINDDDVPFEELDDGMSQPPASIEVKGDLVTIDKDIVEACDANTGNDPGNPQKGECGHELPLSGNEIEDSWTANVGDPVNFAIRTNVPFYLQSHNPEFIIHDTWSAGLKDPSDVVVNEGGLVAGTDYELFVNPEPNQAEIRGRLIAGRSFSIVFTNPTNLAGTQIVVEYTMVIDKVTPVAGENYSWDTNTAWVEFSNVWFPKDNGNETTDADEVDIYTFDFQVIKADLNNRSTFLGAEFKVTNLTKHKESTGSTAETVAGYTFSGLAGNSWYKVEETDVPDGYTDLNMSVTTFWVYIDANHAEMGNTTTGDGGAEPKWYFFGSAPSDVSGAPSPLKNTIDSAYVNPETDVDGDDANNMSVLVLNAKSASDMPSTGGQILLFVGLAGTLGLGAVTFGALGLRKRKAAAVEVA